MPALNNCLMTRNKDLLKNVFIECLQIMTLRIRMKMLLSAIKKLRNKVSLFNKRVFLNSLF